jgi:hypothetical protein
MSANDEPDDDLMGRLRRGEVVRLPAARGGYIDSDSDLGGHIALALTSEGQIQATQVAPDGTANPPTVLDSNALRKLAINLQFWAISEEESGR